MGAQQVCPKICLIEGVQSGFGEGQELVHP
jgi:hypothetical protein